LDEMGSTDSIAHWSSTTKELWQLLLRMLNDTMQGTAIGLGFVLGGTPEFLQDNQRGLHSYKALQAGCPKTALPAPDY